jgi:carbon-monoxide dehydrogenase medium subunit
MKPAPFTYHDPHSVAELTSLLAGLENAKVLAGGQSLMPMLNMRYVMPDHVVDINGITDLSYIRRVPAGLEIGAMTRQREILEAEEVRRTLPLLTEALSQVGHIQTRARGTIGGSLCHLDPAAEQPAVATAYDATLTIAGPQGTRQLAIADWPVAYMTPNLEANEVLTAITFPAWPQPHGYAFVEFARRHGDFALVGVACLLTLDGAGQITRAALALSGLDVRPLRLRDIEQSLVGQKADQPTFAAAGAEARRLEVLSDAYASQAYRQRVAAVLIERALLKAATRAGSTHHG